MNTNINTNMNNLQQFTSKKNIDMLWEVLLDELNVNLDNKVIMTNVKTVFESNINLFISKANPSSGLMNLNKLFLSQIITAVNRLFPNLKQDQDQQQMKLINISDEIMNEEPYKVEDIHSARQTDFEKQVNQRRSDFDNLVNIKKPKELDFSDKTDNSKIVEMEALIAETVAKRKFDIDQIQTNLNTNTYTNTNTNNSEEWLTSNETSLRSDKQQQNDNSNDLNQRKHKYVNINSLPKKVSFNEGNNITMNIEEFSDELPLQSTTNIPTNIFNKLKKIPLLTQEQTQDQTQSQDQSIQTQINNLNNKIDTLFTMMDQMATNVKQIMEK